MIALDNPLGLAHFFVWTVGLSFICYGLSKRYPWTACLAFGITVFSSLRIYQSSLNGIPVNPVIREFIGASEAALISFFFTVMVIQAISLRAWMKIFQALAVLNALLICSDSLFFTIKGLVHHLPLSELRNHEPWGILLNASMSGCFNAAIFPLIRPKDKILRGLILISIFAAGRSLPVAVLFSGIGASLILRKRFRDLSIAIVISFLIGFLVKGGDLFDPRGRDHIWSMAYTHFHDHLPFALGGGLGSFYVVGPALSYQQNTSIFTWLHSDWFQTFFEQGVIGLAIIVLMYLHALWRSRMTPELFSALIAYAAFGVANMPLRYPLSGLLGAFLLRWAMEKPGLPQTLLQLENESFESDLRKVMSRFQTFVKSAK